MAKTSAQLDRDIAQTLGLPAAFVKKWRAGITAYKRAVTRVEEGYSEDGFRKMVQTRDALDKLIYTAGALVPYVAGRSAHESDAIRALEQERKDLVASTWSQAQERGREANYRGQRTEIKRLEEQERDVRQPYAWIRR